MSELGFLGLMGLGGNNEKARCLGALFHLFTINSQG
jgi:hypothetical protein